MSEKTHALIYLSLFLFLSSSYGYAQVNLNQGLVAYYPFNGNANDVINNNNGIVMNGAQLTTDRLGNINSAYHFDGVDDYIQIPNTINLNPSNAMSVALYFNPEQNGVQTLIGKIGYLTGVGTQFQVAMDFSLYPGVLFGVNPASNGCTGVPLNAAYANTGGGPVPTDQWYCIVGTFDNGTLKIYLNGALIQTVNTGFTALNQCSNADIQIGSWWVGDPQTFKGKIDEVRIYNRAINQQEVNALCVACIQPQGALQGSTVCSGAQGNLTFIANGGTAPYAITYSDQSMNLYNQNNIDSGYSFLTPFPLTDTTTFTLQSITDASGCSSAINSAVTINVKPIPQAGITGGTACAGDTAYLTFTSTQGSQPFSIQFTDGTSTYRTDGLQASSVVPLISNNGTFTLLSVSDKSGCTRYTGFTAAVATVSTIPSPQISFASLPAICKSDSSFIITQAQEVSGLAGNGFFSGNGVTASGLFDPSLINPGTYPIQYNFVATNGCKSSSVQNIVVKPVPIANAGPDLVGCMNSSFQLNATGGTNYLWTPPDGLSNPAIANPVITINTTTSYIVAVTNADGCTAFDTLTIFVSPLGRAAYKVPNAFTPNGDGKNDCFGLQHWSGINLQEFSVYNRWGQRVFFTTDPSVCWDGAFKGIPQDSGGFIYVIRATTPCGVINLKGTIMLIR